MMLKDLICKCFIGFGCLSTTRSCIGLLCEPEIPVELLND